MKLVSAVSLVVFVLLFARVWAAQGDSESASAEQSAAEPVSTLTDDASATAEQPSATAAATDKAGSIKPKKREIRWQSDLKIAHELALELNRPMLIVFDADWCSYCRKMERTTLAEPELITQINREFVPVHLNLDEHTRIAEILEVKRIPCTVALSPRADLLGRLTGYVNRQQYGESLSRVLDLHKKVGKQLASVEK